MLIEAQAMLDFIMHYFIPIEWCSIIWYLNLKFNYLKPTFHILLNYTFIYIGNAWFWVKFKITRWTFFNLTEHAFLQVSNLSSWKSIFYSYFIDFKFIKFNFQKFLR